MTPISFKRHRFPPEIIRHAIWLYARFTLSFRDVEELLAERGIDASYETVRRWFLKFKPSIAANIRRSRLRSPWEARPFGARNSPFAHSAVRLS
jgi:putative transposase